jgi:hypothetical protein
MSKGEKDSITDKYMSFATKARWVEEVVTIGFLVNPGSNFLPNVNLNVTPEDDPSTLR